MHYAGEPYRQVVRLKNGVPVYRKTNIIEVQHDKLKLIDGTIIDFVPIDFDELRVKKVNNDD
jgi:hypothetical protein